jgi:hypothetical protein
MIAQRIFCWGTVLAVVLTRSVQAAPLDPKLGYVMVPSHARDLLHQCSRTTVRPETVSDVWTPDASQIADLEARLPDAVMRAQPDVHAGVGRQYAGLVIAGRKLIYVNAFPAGDLGDIDKDRSHLAYKATHQAMMVCDGGHDFFGVFYDPQSKTFSDFAFNGFA